MVYHVSTVHEKKEKKIWNTATALLLLKSVFPHSYAITRAKIAKLLSLTSLFHVYARLYPRTCLLTIKLEYKVKYTVHRMVSNIPPMVFYILQFG